ncbi:hypothetical protein KI387_007951 [Taxus chinensis]|uniref:F-box domain-containing protein n=1 Tax=Taxus chinensis TaxID=29808 RepID=A0AA38GST9_TAXCH|nr:hypothetical protein KI387_007951 [Taxus chinensis]
MEIFASLPEEVGRECLLRVSCQFHSTLRGVCKSWESVVDSPQFYDDRQKIGSSEQCICLIQALPCVDKKSQHRMPIYALTLYDPLHGLWQRKLPPFPELAHGIPLFSECVTVKNKLILIGGWHPSRWEAMKTVFVYDFSSDRWRKGADMPTVRSFFACSASSSEGLVYIAGGHDDSKNALRAAAVYDVEQDKWQGLPEMREERDECRGALVEGKFYVISGYDTQSQGRFKQSAEVFDPNSAAWISLESMWSVGGCPGSCVVFFEYLYAFHKCGVIFRYDSRGNVWKEVATLPEELDSVRGATVWRDTIFVSGTAGVCYMFHPPPLSQKHVNGSRQNWVAVDNTQNFAGIVQSAATLQI